MTYGTIKVDTVTFTDAGVDKSVTLSGLVQNPTFSGNVTVTGTLSGVTVTGTTANFTSGNFTNISGGTHTITSGVFAAGSAASPSITFTGDLNTGIYSPGADQVAISTGGSGRLFVDANGCVGVGAAPDNQAYRLQIYNASQDAAYLSIGNSVSGSGALNGLVVGQNQGDSFFINRENGSQQFYTNGSERLRITSAGLVGVGTSSPVARLETISTATVNGVANCTFRSSDNASSSFYIGHGAGGIANLVSDSPIGFGYNNGGTYVERMRLDASGRLGVGTTSPSGPLAVVSDSGGLCARLQGRAGDSIGTLQFRDNADTATQGYIQGRSTGLRIGTSSGNPLIFLNDSTEQMRLDSSGRLGIGTSSPRGVIDAIGTAYLGSTSAGGRALVMNEDAGGAMRISSSSNAFGLALESGFSGPGYIQFRIGGTNYATLTSTGLGIGTTSPSSALSVTSSANTTWFTFRGTTSGFDYGTFTNSAAQALGYLGAGNSAISTALATDLALRAETNLVFASNGNFERARIDSSGRLLVGTSSARSNFSLGTPTTQFETATSNFNQGLSIINNGGTVGYDPTLTLGATRGASVGSNTAIPSAGYGLGRIDFAGADGTTLLTGARIAGVSDGGWGTNDGPSALVFSTTADGASSPTERMRLTSTGQLRLAGAGITFNGDTAAANELDDYEEGTWTPSVGGNATYSNQTGKYVKIGSYVFVKAIINITALGTGSGQFVTGLPFTPAGVSGITLGYCGKFTSLAVNAYSVYPALGWGTATQIGFGAQQELDGSNTNANLTVFQDNTRIDFCLGYYV